MKYIIINELVDGDEKHAPYIFPRHIQHDQFATKVVAQRKQKGFVFGQFEGAGFVTIGDDDQMICFGRSLTLNINSNESDSEIINHAFSFDDYKKLSIMFNEQDVFDFYTMRGN